MKRIQNVLDGIPMKIAYIGFNFIEVLPPSDPRTKTNTVNAARLAVINGLKEEKVWKVISKYEVP